MLEPDEKVTTPETLEVTQKLKKAPKGHFAHPFAKGAIRSGMIFYLYNPKTEVLDNKDYYTSEDMDVTEFVQWFQKGMIYVPVTFFDDIDNENEKTSKEVPENAK
ncbi:hypothetical protein SAMN05216480_12343 [Pustulibacterium marinum]|uniref:Uncharacterized protein n=1 Tax=Pustulibacterium marinum TaxID=1224947 RepID=A0A1I7IWK4_9FLAO|nr:hypothetical protein [Pustulibacterium marinum]SFU77325.1 hypothetical protein SAMN05216480_12343 [Pustulibacterium marinum]